jgi:hypothetical protein
MATLKSVKPRKHIPVAGERYGKLQIIQRVHDDNVTKSANLKLRVRVQCECGNRLTIPFYYLIRAQPAPKTSCGKCGEKSLMNQYASTHRCWYMMNYRCTNENHVAYKHYGGRGIKVCDEWSWDNPDGFRNFLEYMGERPSLKMSIDRVDVNGNYEPFHPVTGERQVRWATMKEQRANQR